MIDPNSTGNFQPLIAMSMGEEVAQCLVLHSNTVRNEETVGFLQHVQLFYIEAALQIKSRFPINGPILKSLTFLNHDRLMHLKLPIWQSRFRT